VGVIISLNIFHLKFPSLLVSPAYGPIILTQGWKISFISQLNQSVNQKINPSINQKINPSINQKINPSIYLSIYLSIEMTVMSS
jgi:hypothetical protein